MRYWFTSDQHFGHKNIIEYCERPFKTLEEMDSTITKKHNQRVKEGDIVFCLGDFCFKGGKQGSQFKAQDYLKNLNGQTIFIKGNHDSTNKTKSIIKSAHIQFGGLDINLVHNPQDFNPSFKLNLCGHVHNAWKSKAIKKHKTVLINVGVDVHDFQPINIQEILDIYNLTKKWK